MTRAGWILPALAAILLSQAHPALGQKPAGNQGFDTFKMVRTRNIFDPDRRPPPSQNSGSGHAAVPVTQADYVALTGTLVTEDKALAFFSGSRADYDCVLPLKDKIAGATITKITPAGVTVEIAGWTAPWTGAASAPAPATASGVLPAPATPFGAVPAPAATIVANPATGAPAPGTSPPAATPNADVARMMRERRQQEMQ